MRTPDGDVIRIEPDPELRRRAAFERNLEVTRAVSPEDTEEIARLQAKISTPLDEVLDSAPSRGWPTQRPPVDEVLQPRREGAYRGARVERLPFAGPVGNEDVEGAAQQIAEALEREGYFADDLHRGNLGMHEGRVVLIDPGFISAGHSSIDKRLPEVLRVAPEPNAATSLMLDVLGYDPWVRRQALGQSSLSPLLAALGGYNMAMLPQRGTSQGAPFTASRT
jgi:hypothetical protein